MMEWFNILMSRLRALFRRESVLQDIEEELRVHVEIETETNIKRGMAPDEARAAAMKSFGDLVRNTERGYDIRGGGWLETVWQDLRYGSRILMKNPGFTLLAVLTLALGIGANTAIFSVVNAVLLKSLPYADPQRIAVLWTDNPSLQFGLHEIPPANADISEWKANTQSFERIAVFTPNLADLSGDGEPERVGGVAASAEFFPLFGVAPQAGRVFTAMEDQPGGDKVVVISHSLWQRRFGGDPDIIGKTLTVNSEKRVIVGVMPPGFTFPRGPEMPPIFGFAGRNDVWIPLAWDARRWQQRSRETVALARLKSGVSRAQAQAELDTIIKQQDQL